MEKELLKYFNFYREKLLPVIRSNTSVTQKLYWYHWLLTHTKSVVFRWIYYALSLKENPYPVIFACAWHDLAREEDWDDLYHWPNAVPIITEIMEKFNDILTTEEKEMVKYAIKNHTIGTIAPDYVSACLRDADRTRLSRECWYKEKFFNTEIWKKIASWSSEDFLKFQNTILLKGTE